MALEGRGIIQRVRFLLDEQAKARLLAETRQTARQMGDEFTRAGNEIGNIDIGLKGAFPRIEAAGAKAAGGIREAFGKTGDFLKSSFNEVAKGMLAAFAVQKIVSMVQSFAGDLYDLGTNAEETQSKFSTTFGNMADSVQQFIDRTANMAGLDRRQGQEMLATAGAIIEGMGASRKEAAAFSQQVIALAADLQSFHNAPIEETFSAVRLGIVGMHQEMHKYGVIITQADVEQRALQVTHKGTAKQLTELEKAQAALNLMLERAGPAMGDLERTSNSTQNTARRLAAEYRDFKTGLANDLMPTISEFVHGLSDNREELFAIAKVMAYMIGGPLVLIYNAFKLVSDVVSGTLLAGFVGVVGGLEHITNGVAWAIEGFSRLARVAGRGGLADSLAATAVSIRTNARELGAWADAAAETTVEIDNDVQKLTGGGIRAGTVNGGVRGKTAAQLAAEADARERAKEAAAAAAKAEDEALSKRIGLLKDAVKVRETEIDALHELLVLEIKLEEQLRKAAPADRAKIASRLGDVREGIAAGEKALGLDSLKPVAAGPLPLMNMPIEQVRVEPFVFHSDTTLVQETFRTLYDNIGTMSQGAAETMGDHFSRAFSMMLADSRNVGRGFRIMAAGLAAGVLGQIGQIAKGKALENLAYAVEDTARGFAALGGYDAGSASAYFQAASTDALAAARWGLVSGGVGALASAAGGGGAARGFTGGNAGGNRTVADGEKAGPDINLWVDGFDPRSARHVERLRQGAVELKDRYGINIVPHYGTGGA
jgi:hypothetical protein